MKALILFFALSSTAFSQDVFSVFNKMDLYVYNMAGKCVESRIELKHPTQLYTKHNKRCSFYKRKRSYLATCENPYKQYTLFMSKEICQKGF